MNPSHPPANRAPLVPLRYLSVSSVCDRKRLDTRSLRVSREPSPFLRSLRPIERQNLLPSSTSNRNWVIDAKGISGSDSATAADTRAENAVNFLQRDGEALLSTPPPALLDDVDDDVDVDGNDADDDAEQQEERLFLERTKLLGRGSLVRGILSLAKEGDPVRQLDLSEAYWRAQKKKKRPTKRATAALPAVVERRGPGRLLSDALLSPCSNPAATHLGDFDVVVAGGTLGLMLAAALQSTSSSSPSEGESGDDRRRRRLRCAVVERGPAVGGGRVQEWNCSRAELEHALVDELGLLTSEELDSCVVTECGPLSVSFCDESRKKSKEKSDDHDGKVQSPPPPLLALEGVLDVGVCPTRLMALLRSKFESAGGKIFERTEFLGCEVFDDGVLLKARGVDVDAVDEEREIPSSSCPPPPRDLSSESGSSSSSSSSSSGSFEVADDDEEPLTTTAGAAKAQKKKATRPLALSTSLLVDCMGHWSPITKAAREHRERGSSNGKPDAVCLVVGACVRLKKGATRPSSSSSLPRSGGEFLVSRSHASSSGADDDADVQWLWEQFPAAGGDARTAYQFAYIDADESRPSLETALEKFFLALPDALGSQYKDNRRVPLSTLEFDRVLFGAFPSYSKAPLRPSHDRILHAGDAAGGASPLSFGGFGAMLRHLPRLAAGVPEALEASRRSAEAAVATSAALAGGKASESATAAAAATASLKPLNKRALSALTPYSPSLSSTWLFASAMRLPPKSVGSSLPPNHVSSLLGANFRVLSLLGTWALEPFVTERVRALPLAATMVGMGILSPLVIARVIATQVRALDLAKWFAHAGLLALYSVARVVATPLRALVSEERRERKRRSTTATTKETRTATTAAKPKGLFPLLLLAVALQLRALRARAFAALARGLDALDFGSGHDGSGGGGSGGVRVVAAAA